MPAQAGSALVRYVDGAPLLEALIDGTPQPLGFTYLQVDNKTAVSAFSYGTISSFAGISAGTHSLSARDTLGYSVGPLKTSALGAGRRYTLVIVGSYPKYQVLTFEEPDPSGDAQLSFYEASPARPQSAFGTFAASTSSGFAQRGSATLGSVVTVGLGKSVSNVGGYVGPKRSPIGTVTPAELNSFDSHNTLPFEQIGRLSLFLFDAKSGTSIGPVFGSLDR